MITVEVDSRRVVTKLTSMPDKVRSALLKKTQYLALKLEQQVKQNLNNTILHFITGELYGSIFNKVTSTENSVEGKVASSASSKAAPYARIQEFGGTTKAHVIEAVNGKALMFQRGGETVFAKKVNHPGSVIPAHHYMGKAFDELKPEIKDSYQEAVQGAVHE